jgi:hypothetical protein
LHTEGPDAISAMNIVVHEVSGWVHIAMNIMVHDVGGCLDWAGMEVHMEKLQIVVFDFKTGALVAHST